MQIQVLGSGCPTCHKLFEIVSQIVSELGIDSKVEYITDIQKIIDIGLMQSPVLVINRKVVLVGFTSDTTKIKKVIQDNI